MTASRLLLAITGARVVFAAAFAWAALADHPVLLLPLAVLVELSDLCDGAVARRTGTASDVGTVYDGMADLVARMTEFICLAAIGAIAFAPVLVFLWQEALAVGAQRVASVAGVAVISGRMSGKVKGATQGACLVWLAATQSVPSIDDAIGDWLSMLLIWLAVTSTVLYGSDYVIAHRAALRTSVSSDR